MNHRPHETHPSQESRNEQRERRGFRLDFKWMLLGFFVIGGYFLFTEHRAHAIAYLPFVLLALCPLMHLFHGHGGHGSDGGRSHGDTHRHDGDPR